MEKEIRKNFTGGMNSDDHDKLIPEGDYRDLLNMRSGLSESSNQGALESIISPLLKTITGGPAAATSVCLGGCRDKENDKVYFLYHEPSVADFIIELDVKSDVADIIMKDPSGSGNVLGFDPAYRIYNSRILDGKIFWTDRNVEVRYIQVDRAKQYMTNGFDSVSTYSGQWVSTTSYTTGDVVGHNGYYWEASQNSTDEEPEDGYSYWTKLSLILDSYNPAMSEDDVLFIATPPLEPCSAAYISDTSRKSNNLRGNLYQFAYRWIYNDFRKSVFSPVSKVTLPQGEETPQGEPNEDVSVNNRLDVRINSGGPEVVQIEIIFRSSKDPSTWYRMTVENKYDDYNYQILADNQYRSFQFFDDVAPFAVSDTEVFKPFHYVPQKAWFLEVIEENHMVFGDCTEGYPEVKLNVEVEKSIIDQTTDPTAIPMEVEIYKENLEPDPPNPLKEEGHYTIILPVIGYVGATYTIREYSNNGATEKIANYVMQSSDEAGYPNSVRDALITACVTQGMDVDTCLITMDNWICFNRQIRYLGQLETYYESIGYWVEGEIQNPTGVIPKYKNLKAGATHGFGLVYYDGRRRQNPVSATKDMGVYLDFYNDDQGSGELEHDENWRVKFILNHLPPSWATHYQVVYTGNLSMSYWIQARIASITFQTGYIEININDYIDAVKTLYRNFEVDKYEFQSGDRFRVIGKRDTVGHTFIMYDRYVDVEVIGTDPDDSDTLRIQRYLNDTDLTTDHVIEIYRPKKVSSANVYYEIGQKYNIVQGTYGLIHKGNIDQVLNSSGQNVSGAEVIVDAHDSYKYLRELADEQFYCESAHFSDYMRPSNLVSLGFPKIEDDLALQVRMRNRLRFGGILSIGTKNNQIADFEYGNYVDLPEKHGGIYGLQEVGYVLKVIQAHKLWSIYIKRTSSFNPDGSENIILTDSVLGTRRPVEADWGTQNPESVLVHNRHLYFWDRSRGQFIRDSANGPFPISDYKMITYFRDRSKDVRSYSDVKCIVGMNETFGELMLHWFWDDHHQETIVFNEYKKRWSHRTSEPVDFYLHFGAMLYATINQKVFIHNLGSNYSEYDGTIYNPSIKFVGNLDPEKVKIWKALSIECNQVMYNASIDAIEIPASPNYTSGMSTRLIEALLTAKEGIYYAPIMKDVNTPKAGWSNDQKIVSGRELRGQFIIITLLSDKGNGTQYILEGVRIRYVDSETS